MGNNCLSSDPDAQAYNVACEKDLSMLYRPIRMLSSSKASIVNLVKDLGTKEELVMHNLVCFDKEKSPQAEAR